MNDLTSVEYQQLLIVLLDASYQPFVTVYVVLWAWAIVQRLMNGL